MIDAMKDMCEGLDWLREHVSPAMVQLSVMKDRAISEALQTIQPLWTPEEIKKRCVFVRPVGNEIETLVVDGIAVIVFYPGETVQEWKEDRLIITHTQKYRRIQAVTPQAANS